MTDEAPLSAGSMGDHAPLLDGTDAPDSTTERHHGGWCSNGSCPCRWRGPVCAEYVGTAETEHFCPCCGWNEAAYRTGEESRVIACERCGRTTTDPDKWDPEADTGRVLCDRCWDIEHDLAVTDGR